MTVVDFGHDLINAGQTLFEQIHRPAFQRFPHHGMVGVGDGTGYNVPRLIPMIPAFVQQNAHQFGDGKYGVGIVGVNGGFFGQIVQRAVFLQMGAHNILH